VPNPCVSFGRRAGGIASPVKPETFLGSPTLGTLAICLLIAAMTPPLDNVAPGSALNSIPMRDNLLAAPHVSGEVSFAINGGATGTSSALSPGAGDSIVVFVCLYGKNTVSSVSDTSGDPFSPLAYTLQSNSVGTDGLAMSIAPNVSQGAAVKITVTIAGTSLAIAAIGAVDVAGVAAAPVEPLGPSADSDALPGHQSASFNLNVSAQPSDLVLAAVAARHFDLWSAAGGDRLLANQVSGTTGSFMTLADFNATTTIAGKVLMQGTSNHTAAWIADGLALKPGAGPARQLYRVTFNETGLPSGTSWSVHLGGSSSSAKAPANVSFTEPNGTYSFSVPNPTGFSGNRSSGPLIVNGGNLTELIGFNQTFSVTFTESGLGTGISWTTSVNGTAQSAISPASIVVNLPNGTYPYTVAPPSGYAASPSSGTVLVAGVPQTVPIVFQVTALHIQHVVVIVLENQNSATVLTSGKAPYQAYLASQYAQATNFYGSCHGSQPDYLALTSARNYGCGKSYTGQIENVANLPDLVERAGLTWAGYFESMKPTPPNCNLPNSGSYLADHNPFVKYTDIRTNTTRCQSDLLSSTSFNTSVAKGTLPAFSFYVPNIYDDCHTLLPPNKNPLAFCDAWLRGFLGPILNQTSNASGFSFNTPAEKTLIAHTLFLIVYDEGTDSSGYYDGYKDIGCLNMTHKDLSACGGHTVLIAVSPFSPQGNGFSGPASSISVESTIEWLFSLGNESGLSKFPPNYYPAEDGSAFFPPMTSLFSFKSN